ncbi:MAG: hypothetical protein ABI977_12580 [Acidobacteriota bacterium]
MSYGTLHWNDWYRAKNWVGDMDRFTWEGRNFTDYLWSAMRKLEADILSGRLFQEVTQLYKANPPLAPNGYDIGYAAMLLRDGKLRFGPQARAPFPPAPLTIHGGNLNLAGLWGQYPGAGYSIFINFGHDTSANTANNSTNGLFQYADANPDLFSKDDVGRLRLEILVGATVIHEIMHLEGASHGLSPGELNEPDIASHPYNRTLPEVAGQAFGEIYFPNNFFFLANGSNKTPAIRCGTSKKKNATDSDFQSKEDLDYYLSQIEDDESKQLSVFDLPS